MYCDKDKIIAHNCYILLIKYGVRIGFFKLCIRNLRENKANYKQIELNFV